MVVTRRGKVKAVALEAELRRSPELPARSSSPESDVPQVSKGGSAMKSRHLFLTLAVGLSVLLWGGEVRTAGQPVKDTEALHLTLSQKDFLALEPILVTVRLESQHIHALPAALGESKSGTL